MTRLTALSVAVAFEIRKKKRANYQSKTPWERNEKCVLFFIRNGNKIIKSCFETGGPAIAFCQQISHGLYQKTAANSRSLLLFYWPPQENSNNTRAFSPITKYFDFCIELFWLKIVNEICRSLGDSLFNRAHDTVNYGFISATLTTDWTSNAPHHQLLRSAPEIEIRKYSGLRRLSCAS